MLNVVKKFFLIFVLSFLSELFLLSKLHVGVEPNTFLPWWQVQSIDTMKYSRDVAAAKLQDPSFDAIIDEQVKNIAQTGATHVAIATPYDSEFIPFLTRWVKAARKYGLNVWFRGNFSGWEGWFSYPPMTRDEHTKNIKDFIINNKDLFVDGDLFSSCPECENGGPGDPRQTGDIEGHRLFLIAEYQVTRNAFNKIGKNVQSNVNSMNYDVASAVMDKRTTKALDGLVAIDHYTATAEKLINDIKSLADKSGGKIFLGEFGVPIPDINGNMTEIEQANWMNDALSKLAYEPEVIGLNYWVNLGGSTALWNDDRTEKKAVSVLRAFYRPKIINGMIKKFNWSPIRNAKVLLNNQSTVTPDNGSFRLIYLSGKIVLKISAEGYVDKELTIDENEQKINIIMESNSKNFVEWLMGFIHNIKQDIVKLAK